MKNLLLTLGIISCWPSLAQERGNMYYGHKAITDVKQLNSHTDYEEITISIKGLMNVSPDDYVAFFHVIQ